MCSAKDERINLCMDNAIIWLFVHVILHSYMRMNNYTVILGPIRDLARHFPISLNLWVLNSSQ